MDVLIVIPARAVDSALMDHARRPCWPDVPAYSDFHFVFHYPYIAPVNAL